MSFEKLVTRPMVPPRFDKLEAYYNGRHRLAALGVNLPPKVRVLEIVVDWPRITCDSLAERLIIEGFRGGEDDHYWDRWQANRLNLLSQLAHLEALVQGTAFVVVGPPTSSEWATITVHAARGWAVRVDPLTGLLLEAVQRYADAEGVDCAAYYVPGAVTQYKRLHGAWKVHDTTDYGSSRMAVVPVTNRTRISDWHGRSEMTDVMRYTDAASRSITELQVATELVALPQRVLLGKGLEQGFLDKDGNTIPEWDVYIGHLMTGPDGAQATQFPGASLDQINSTVRLYASMVSGSTGLPLQALGIAADSNPASAEALNAADNRHVRKAEQKQVLFGEAWEEVQRVADEIDGHGTAPARLETQWRDAATPTLQSKAQAVTSLVTANIIPASVARDIIGLTPEQKRIADDEDATFRNLVQQVGK